VWVSGRLCATRAGEKAFMLVVVPRSMVLTRVSSARPGRTGCHSRRLHILCALYVFLSSLKERTCWISLKTQSQRSSARLASPVAVRPAPPDYTVRSVRFCRATQSIAILALRCDSCGRRLERGRDHGRARRARRRDGRRGEGDRRPDTSGGWHEDERWAVDATLTPRAAARFRAAAACRSAAEHGDRE